MSDTYPKQRAFPDNRDARSGNGSAAASDPLAELARLVGRDDPFKNLFTARDTQKPTRPERVEPPLLPTPDPFDRFDRGQDVRRAGALNYGVDPAGHADDRHLSDDAVFHAPLGQPRQDAYHLPPMADEHGEYDAYGDGAVGGHPAAAPSLNPDLWAQGMPEPVSADPLHYAPGLDDTDGAPEGTRKRTLVVLAAVLALTAGGLGATFLVRGGSSATASGTPPTIMADTGPTKIQPPDTSNQSTGGDGNTALIEKSASDNVNSAKVVNTQEQPVDLSQLPKAPSSAAPTDGRTAVATLNGGDAASTGFPEPRKVKTVMVRPDGSVVGADDGQAAAPAATAPAEPVAKPATPKSAARATATPRSDTTPTDSAPTKAKPVTHAAAKAKPVQTAEATPAADANDTAPTAAAATGGFAVQLAAPPSEQEAKEISARLQKKFAGELDGRAPTIRKADNKSVYRVRVGSLTQDDAKALCAKLQASGGSCFVVRN